PRLGDGGAPPAERRDVLVHGLAVDADGLLDGLRRDRQRPHLVGGADDEEVGGGGVAEELLGRGERVEGLQAPRHRAHPLEQVGLVGVPHGAVVDHVAGGGAAGGGRHQGAAGVAVGEVALLGGGEQVERDDAGGAAGGDPVGGLQGFAGEPQ